jgi:AAA15 family ATPase/GTPase
MLYRVIVNNYKSFAEEQQFDMFPNPKRENFPCHVLKSKQNIPVLKECAIYGANGSGKSNFIKLLQFLKDFVTEDMFSLQKLNNWYHINRFKLPIAKNNTPIEILIEFGINEIVYIYSLSIDDKGVKEEKLYLSGKGYNEEVLVFSRNYSDIEFTITHISPEIENIFKRQLSSNPAASVLGINGTLRLIDNEIINNAYTWFDKNLKIVSFNRQIPWLIELFKANDELLKFVNKVFTNIGLGINSLDIKESNVNDWIENHKQEDSNKINKVLETGNHYLSKISDSVPIFSIHAEEGMQTVREFIFNQIGINGYVGEMETIDQSTGTCRLLTLLPALYDAINEEATVFVDEIDNGIHPVLIKKLLLYFGNMSSKGQLIYTTHETALLDQQHLLRADEVWLTEKISGVTKMYSLNIFKIHKTISIENGYLEGRYGAIPFLGNLE